MTALAAEPTALVEPRLPQLSEMAQAAVRMHQTTDTLESAYWHGVTIGYAVAFGIADHDRLLEARATIFSAAYTLEDCAARMRLLRDFPGDRRPSWLASGIRFGFKQGTAERVDADECGMCEERILTRVDDHEACRNHGPFCSDDCRRTYCGGRRSCWDE